MAEEKVPTKPRRDHLEPLYNQFETLTNLLRLHNEVEVEELERALDEIVETVQKMRAVAGGASDELRLDNFLTAMASSYIQAQEHLDAESRKYLEKFVEDDTAAALPAVFRIPKFQAEIKYALEKAEKDKLNLLFFRSTKEAKERHQQSLSFELAAVPPPPDLLERLQRRGPGVLHFASSKERKLLKDLFDFDADRRSCEHFSKRWQDALVLKINGSNQFLAVLGLADGPDKKALLLWANREENKDSFCVEIELPPEGLDVIAELRKKQDDATGRD